MSAAPLLPYLPSINLRPTEQHSTGLPSPSFSTFHPLQLLSRHLKADIEFMCTCVSVCVCRCVCLSSPKRRDFPAGQQPNRSRFSGIFVCFLLLHFIFSDVTQSLWKNRKTWKTTTTHSMTCEVITSIHLKECTDSTTTHLVLGNTM